MGPKSSSHELSSRDEYQLAFPRESCPSCKDNGGCPFAGTTYQCWAISVMEGDIQPGTPEASFWIQQLGGLDIRMDGLFASTRLPGAIPRVEPQRAAGPATAGISWVALSLSGVLREGGTRIRSKQEIIDATGMEPTVRTVLAMTDTDERLSTLGTARSELIHSIQASGHDLVLSPLFSVWDGYSPFLNRIQIAYMDRFARDLAEAGVPTIPSVCWYETPDLDDLAAAVNANPSIRILWVDWQTVPPRAGWRRALRGLDKFASLVPQVRFVVNGVGECRRQDLWARDYVSSVVSSREFMSAMRENAGGDAVRVAQQHIRRFVAEGETWRPSAPT